MTILVTSSADVQVVQGVRLFSPSDTPSMVVYREQVGSNTTIVFGFIPPKLSYRLRCFLSCFVLNLYDWASSEHQKSFIRVRFPTKVAYFFKNDSLVCIFVLQVFMYYCLIFAFYHSKFTGWIPDLLQWPPSGTEHHYNYHHICQWCSQDHHSTSHQNPRSDKRSSVVWNIVETF